MTFLDEVRADLNTKFSEIQDQIKGYVPRILVKEDTSRQEVVSLRSLRRLVAPDPDQRLLEDAQITKCSRLIIIGDAGSGKSHIIWHAYSIAAQAFLNSSANPFPCFLDLRRDLSQRSSVEEALEDVLRRRYLFDKLLSEHKPGCILFLDALDERLMFERNDYDFVNGLLNFFQDYQERLPSVVLVCRRVFWNQDWLRSQSPWLIYHADHLDFEDYAAIIPDPTARQEFFNQASSLGIADLLGLPFFGFDLARKFNQGQRLPESRQDWFQQHIKEALAGTESDRIRGKAPPLDSLLMMAQHLACLSTFRMTLSWTDQEAINQLGSSRTLHSEYDPITTEQVQILLQRPLFTKQDGKFSFSHQLFREYLAAESLKSLPLRKQRQLLTSPSTSLQHRILTPHRGVAVFLAEMSPQFCKYLIENDPLIAFFAEVLSLPPETDERLTKAVIDDAITNHRASYWEVPPRGERPINFLHKHRPKDVSDFLQPYLERTDEISLLWVADCVVVWEGDVALNARLLDLAHNDELNVQIRTNAIDAILASKVKEHIQELYDLLDSRNDRVRGHVLQAYRLTEMPTPQDYIAKLHGGAHDDSLLSWLQVEVSSFGLLLDEANLKVAFNEAMAHFDELGNLLPPLAQGLFHRANELYFDDIPPPLIVKLWLGPSLDQVHYNPTLKQLISTSPNLFTRVWNYVIEELRQGNQHFYYHSHQLRLHLAEVCNDQIFELIPTDRTTLNWYQDVLISEVLRAYFDKEPTAGRLQLFRERAPSFTGSFRLPQPASISFPSRYQKIISRFVAFFQQLKQEITIRGLLSRKKLSVQEKTFELLKIIAQILYGDKRTWLESEAIIELLQADLTVSLRKRILEIFSTCTLHLRYSRKLGDSPGQWTMTDPKFAIPFWVSWNSGIRFPIEKLDEFIRCYAFSGFPHSNEPELYYPLLDELRDLDSLRWGDTVTWLIEFPPTSSYGPLEYLIARESNLYIDRCRQRLSQCNFNIPDFHALLKYWMARKPSDYVQILRACYECVESEDQKIELLYALLAEDDNWAWNELHSRIKAGNPPQKIDHSSLRYFYIADEPSRLPILADWYAWIRRNQENDHAPFELRSLLEVSIIKIGGEEAIAELQRLQRERAFPDAKWLSHVILRIEDQMLGVIDEIMEPGQLIDFINRESFGVVLTERDLFEWVCQAIEDVKDGLENRAEQVHGYWNRTQRRDQPDEWRPKTEPECQNVLWPTIQSRLSNLNIVGVEEHLVRADRADFWVEKPNSSAQPFRVIVELKTAREDYGHRELIEPIESQLWQQYLCPNDCKYGIFIVLWFKDESRYPHPRNWGTLDEFEQELSRFKEQVENSHNIHLACYAIDMTTSARIR